jgi:hypothetical protein
MSKILGRILGLGSMLRRPRDEDQGVKNRVLWHCDRVADM